MTTLTLTETQKKRSELLRKLTKGHGCTLARLLQLTPEDLKLFNAKSIQDLVESIQEVIYFLKLTNQRGYILEAALNLNGLYPMNLLERLDAIRGVELVSRRSIQRYKDRCLNGASILFDDLDSLREVNDSPRVVVTEKSRDEKQIATLQASFRDEHQRVRELEKFLRQLMASEHVPVSVKKQIRTYL